MNNMGIKHVIALLACLAFPGNLELVCQFAPPRLPAQIFTDVIQSVWHSDPYSTMSTARSIILTVGRKGLTAPVCVKPSLDSNKVGFFRKIYTLGKFSTSKSPDVIAAASTFPQTHSYSHSQQLCHLELRIPTSRVGLYPQPPANITSDTLAQSTMTINQPYSISSDFTGLLSGPLDDFLLYSGREQSQWLIDIAHDICDPAMKRGSLQVWDVAAEKWRKVNGTDPLTASTYLYDIQDIISLSKISKCKGESKTSAVDNASASRVKQRDGQQCWVSRIESPTSNCYLCPKQMGNHLFRVVYSTFVSTPPPALSIYDEICGITLTLNLDIWFDTYELGLRFVAPVRSKSSLFSSSIYLIIGS
jgi:hypothetical protein